MKLQNSNAFLYVITCFVRTLVCSPIKSFTLVPELFLYFTKVENISVWYCEMRYDTRIL